MNYIEQIQFLRNSCLRPGITTIEKFTILWFWENIIMLRLATRSTANDPNRSSGWPCTYIASHQLESTESLSPLLE